MLYERSNIAESDKFLNGKVERVKFPCRSSDLEKGITYFKTLKLWKVHVNVIV